MSLGCPDLSIDATGGLSIAKGKDYVWNPEAIHKMKHSGSYMTKQIAVL
jgi:alkaline phosphatase